MAVVSLKYPAKSHRKVIRLPDECGELAELMGIIFGDGGINNEWQLVISLNAEADREYAVYISQLLRSLFDIKVAQRRRPRQKTTVLVCSSMNLLDFLVQKGAVRGNKIAQEIDIPQWIRDNAEYQKAFVRGLVDTDGCLYIHKHTVGGRQYEHIGFCFTSLSLPLIQSVAAILRKHLIEPHITDKGRRIYLYNSRSVSEYLRIFGSSNPRILRKFTEWRGARVADRARLESV